MLLAPGQVALRKCHLLKLNTPLCRQQPVLSSPKHLSMATGKKNGCYERKSVEKGRFLFPPTNVVPVMVEERGHDAGLCPARSRQAGPPSGGGPWDPLVLWHWREHVGRGDGTWTLMGSLSDLSPLCHSCQASSVKSLGAPRRSSLLQPSCVSLGKFFKVTFYKHLGG